MARHKELSVPAGNERRQKESYEIEARRLDEAREQLERAVTKCEAVEALGRRERREQLPDALSREEMWGKAVKQRTAALEQIEPPGTEARRERELAEQVLTQRAAKALAAARIEPPSYVVSELGERPTEPSKARVWDRGVREIEGYRFEHGVEDTGHALGHLPKDGPERAVQRAAERRLIKAQRRLGLDEQLGLREQTRSIEQDFGVGL